MAFVNVTGLGLRAGARLDGHELSCLRRRKVVQGL